METNDISLSLKVLERDSFHTVLRFNIITIFVIVDYATAKASEPMCKCLSHIAETDDTDCKIAEFATSVGLTTPETPTHLGIGTGYIVEQSEKQPNGMLADGVTVTFRTVDATYTVRLGIIHIYGFHPGPHPANASERRRTINKITVNLNLAANNEAIAPLYGSQKALVVVVGLDSHLKASLAQPLGQHAMCIVCYQYLIH